MAKLTIDGYGQVELNNCAFRRDGRIEAQCKPNETDFSGKKIENGMIVAIDKVTNEVKLPTATDKLPRGLVYSAEHTYDERKPGLKDFALNATDDFLPRIGYLAKGDLYTTNLVELGTTTTANLASTTSMAAGIFAAPNTNGVLALTSAMPTSGLALKAVNYTTMPDGQLGIKFQVIAD